MMTPDKLRERIEATQRMISRDPEAQTDLDPIVFEMVQEELERDLPRLLAQLGSFYGAA